MDLLSLGDTGPEVERVQRIVGAPLTGVYDEETVLLVRGMQVVNRIHPTDGCWDAELEQAVSLMHGGSS